MNNNDRFAFIVGQMALVMEVKLGGPMLLGAAAFTALGVPDERFSGELFSNAHECNERAKEILAHVYEGAPKPYWC
jgi:hypothetical protein